MKAGLFTFLLLSSLHLFISDDDKLFEAPSFWTYLGGPIN